MDEWWCEDAALDGEAEDASAASATEETLPTDDACMDATIDFPEAPPPPDEDLPDAWVDAALPEDRMPVTAEKCLDSRLPTPLTSAPACGSGGKAEGDLCVR